MNAAAADKLLTETRRALLDSRFTERERHLMGLVVLSTGCRRERVAEVLDSEFEDERIKWNKQSSRVWEVVALTNACQVAAAIQSARWDARPNLTLVQFGASSEQPSGGE